MISFDDVFKIGYLGKSHGLQGEINFHYENDIFIESDCSYLILNLDGILTPFFINNCRLKNEEIALIHFENMDTSHSLQNILGKEVYLPKKYMDDDILDVANLSNKGIWANLISYSAYNETGEFIGIVKDIDTQTINVLLLLEDEEGLQRIIPAVDSWILDLNNENKKVIFSLPEGLLD